MDFHCALRTNVTIRDVLHHESGTCKPTEGPDSLQGSAFICCLLNVQHLLSAKAKPDHMAPLLDGPTSNYLIRL